MYVGNIANIAVGRLHAYKAGNRHLLAAELGIRLGKSLYMLQRGLSPPPLPWSVSIIIMQPSLHRYSTVSMLSGSSVYVVSAVPRKSVIPSGISSLGRQSITSSLQVYFSLSSLGSSLWISLTSVVSADCRVLLGAFSLLSSLGRQSILAIYWS